MDYEQLKTFICVVEQGGFTRAGEALGSSHSTTSRSVAALEESLGLVLLKRTSRSMTLTPAGELLLREGKKLLDASDSLKEELKALAGRVNGKLGVALANIKSDVFDSLCREFCAEYPAVELSMQSCALSQALSLVRDGRADVGVSLSYVLPDDLEDYELRRIAASDFCAIVSEKSALAAKQSVSSGELRQYPYIGAGRLTSGFAAAVEYPVTNDRPQEDIISVTSLDSLFMQVRCGDGVSLVPRPMARKLAAGCALLDLPEVKSDFDIVAFWRKDSENPLTDLFGRFTLPEGDIQ